MTRSEWNALLCTAQKTWALPQNYEGYTSKRSTGNCVHSIPVAKYVIHSVLRRTLKFWRNHTTKDEKSVQRNAQQVYFKELRWFTRSKTTLCSNEMVAPQISFKAAHHMISLGRRNRMPRAQTSILDGRPPTTWPKSITERNSQLLQKDIRYYRRRKPELGPDWDSSMSAGPVWPLVSLRSTFSWFLCCIPTLISEIQQ